MRRLLGAVCIAFAVGCTGQVGEAVDSGTPAPDGGATGGGLGGGSGGGGGEVDAGEDAGLDAGLPDAGPFDDGGSGLEVRPPNPTCIAPPPPPNNSGVTTQRVFPALSFSQPIGLFNAPGDPNRVFVQERLGTIRSFPNQNDAGVGSVQLVLDITGRVDAQGEGGFLGMAFHPRWPTVPEVFVSYTETASPLRTVVSRFKSLDSGLTLSAASEERRAKSEERVFTVDQPYNNHNGGSISFGPDGFLYLGLGDGGSGGDPTGSGQRLNTTLGKFIRIDVNVPFAQKYAIPPTNPYAADNTQLWFVLRPASGAKPTTPATATVNTLLK